MYSWKNMRRSSMGERMTSQLLKCVSRRWNQINHMRGIKQFPSLAACLGEPFILEYTPTHNTHTCGLTSYSPDWILALWPLNSAKRPLWRSVSVAPVSAKTIRYTKLTCFRCFRWAQLYFVAWYLISVILIINLFVALILEVSSLPFSVAIVS